MNDNGDNASSLQENSTANVSQGNSIASATHALNTNRKRLDYVNKSYLVT